MRSVPVPVLHLFALSLVFFLTLTSFFLVPSVVCSSDSDDTVSANYGEPCDNTIPCNGEQNLICIPRGAGQCRCTVINSIQWVYDEELGKCFNDPSASPLSPPNIGPHHHHYNPDESPKVDQQQPDFNSPGGVGHGRSAGHPAADNNNNGRSCAVDIECRLILGELSKCDLTRSTCICYDTITQGRETVAEYNGKCLVVVAEGQHCSNNAQCMLSDSSLKCVPEEPGSYMKRCTCQGENCKRNQDQVSVSVSSSNIIFASTSFCAGLLIAVCLAAAGSSVSC